jgi:TATA-box binding protein (TBP) (component of TFIID and TFIIIB)
MNTRSKSIKMGTAPSPPPVPTKKTVVKKKPLSIIANNRQVKPSAVVKPAPSKDNRRSAATTLAPPKTRRPLDAESCQIFSNPEYGKNIPLKVNNVFTAFSTKCLLNLRKIGLEGQNVEFKRGTNRLTMRLRKPLTTAYFYASGKAVCMGAKSEADAYTAVRRICRLLQKLDFKVRLTNYRVVNVLAGATLPFTIDIRELAREHATRCTYEPELSAGAAFRLSELGVTLSIFNSGSVSITAPSVRAARSAINKIYPLLYTYRRQFTMKPPQLDENNNIVVDERPIQQQTVVVVEKKSIAPHVEIKRDSSARNMVVKEDSKQEIPLISLVDDDDDEEEAVGLSVVQAVTSPAEQSITDISVCDFPDEILLSVNVENVKNAAPSWPVVLEEESKIDQQLLQPPVVYTDESSTSEHLFAAWAAETATTATGSTTTSSAGLYSSDPQSAVPAWFTDNLFVDSILDDYIS